MASLETQYNNYKSDNPNSEISFEEWKEQLGNMIQSEIQRLRIDYVETWEDIEEEYHKDEYPVFGGPFTDARTPFEWLKIYYNPPKRK
jgi:hypothetical protein